MPRTSTKTKPEVEKVVAKLYGGSITIEFSKAAHRYKVNGESGTPSVTSVTGLLHKPALVFWSANLARDFLLEHLQNGNSITQELIIEAAKQHTIRKEKEATSGTLVHAWAESYINGENPPMPEDPRVANGATAFLKWVQEHDVKFLASEKIVYSKKHQYVGIMDCMFTMGSEKHEIKHVGDFKTSGAIYNEMLYQVSAYQAAEEEESGVEYGDKWIIRFDKDTAEFEALSFSGHQKDLEAFLGLLAVRRREAELKK